MSHEVDTRSLEEGMKRFEAEAKAEAKRILKKASVAYGEGAVRYVPPRVNGSWSRSIPAKLYKRHFIIPLSKYVRSDKTNSKLFGEKLREGYRFGVKGQLHGKTHWWFATTLRKTVQYTRIFNRGLFKFLFGANFASIGEQTPPIFQKLLAKSPNLGKHKSLHIIELKTQGDDEGIRIVNNAFGNDAFARESRYRGDKAAQKTMNRMWKEFAKQRRQA